MTQQDTPAVRGAGPAVPRPRERGTAATGQHTGGPRPVRLAVEHLDPTTGLRTRQLVVVDESDDSPTREASQAAFAALDALLVENPSWRAPSTGPDGLEVDNAASAWVYSSPAMRQWRTHLVPRATALYVLQRPDSQHLLPGWTPVDALCRTFVVDGLDGIGIRTRARMLQDAVSDRLGAALEGGRARWVSLACGAAVPVLDVMARTGLSGAELVLVDIDDEALAFAGDLAREAGLVEGADFSLLRRNLVSGVVARAELVEELGAGSATVVDALGIFEYFSDASCVRLLRNAWDLLEPGGVLVVANMLADRPELALNQRGLGWPSIVPRSPERLVELVRKAGLPLDRTTVSTAQDGVYAVVDVVR